MFTATFDEVVAEVKAIADERPDYIYPYSFNEEVCMYFSDGQPSCIVGHWLARRGVTVDDIRPFNTGAGPSVFRSLGIANLDSATVHFLSNVQAAQDTGTPWGEAFAKGLDQIQRA